MRASTTVLFGIALLVGVIAAPVQAHHASTHTAESSFWSYDNAANPYMVFQKGTNTNSTLSAYVSLSDGRYRVQMRAGSGVTTNECERDKGWLPSGTYSSITYHENKTWGDSDVVRGTVWQLENKACSGGSTTRTELFIHSSGEEGTPWSTPEDYKSQGCIKISQLDRYSSSGASLKTYMRTAYNRDSETLSVRD